MFCHMLMAHERIIFIKSKPEACSYFTKTTRATVQYASQELGYLYYEKLPFSIYVIHTFFVKPPYRNKGIGTHLLQKICQEIKNQGGIYIFVQPGPFELHNNEFRPVIINKSKKLEQLVHLYKKAGFNLAPPLLTMIAGFIYKLIRLHEDAQYLMIQ